MSELVLYERNDTVAVITLNRPERLNAMDQSMLEALNQAAQRAEQDDHIRAVVLTGSGNAFSSGFDLKAQAEHTPRGIDEWRPILRRNFDACMTFWHLAKPTVAAVHGPALAGACELAMACDITVADETAVFGEPELRFGAGIVVMLLPWMVGPKRAKEIILLGLDNISAQEAAQIGLVNRVVPKGKDLETALSIASRLSRIDQPLMAQTKPLTKLMPSWAWNRHSKRPSRSTSKLKVKACRLKPDFYRLYEIKGCVQPLPGATA